MNAVVDFSKATGSARSANASSLTSYRVILDSAIPQHQTADGTADVVSLGGERLIFINRFYHPDVSATSQMLYDLTRRLARCGYEVHVICSRQLYGDAKAHLPAHEIIEGVHVHRVMGTRFGRDQLSARAIDYASFYLWAFVMMLKLVRNDDVLIVKTDPPLISVPAALVSRLRGAHLVNWLQDLFPEVASLLGHHRIPRWAGAMLRWLRDRSLKAAAINVVIGENMKQCVLARGVPSQSIRVIENWSDGEFVTPKATVESRLHSKLELDGKFVVGYSGNLGRAHEFETMLKAAIQLQHHKDVVFLMIGGGARMQQLRSAVDAAGLRNFLFLPYQPRHALSDSMAAVDVHLTCLLPELEGLIVPSKFYGILAAGRPTVAIGDTAGEIAHIVMCHGCGVAVQTGHYRQLADILLMLKSDANLRSVMGKRARELFVAQHTADHGALRWRKALADIRTTGLMVPALA